MKTVVRRLGARGPARLLLVAALATTMVVAGDRADAEKDPRVKVAGKLVPPHRAAAVPGHTVKLKRDTQPSKGLGEALEQGSIFLYDAKCPLCKIVSWSVMKAERVLSPFNRRLKGRRTARFSLHDKEVYNVFEGLDRQACEKDLHLLEKLGNGSYRVHKGDEMVRYFAINFGFSPRHVLGRAGQAITRAYYNGMHGLRNAINRTIERRAARSRGK